MLVPINVDILASTLGDTAAATPISPDTEPVSVELAYGRVIYVIENEQQSTHYELVQHGDLTLAGMTQAQLHASAISQLTQFANHYLELIERQDELFELTVGGEFEASLVLIDELWAEVMPKFVGVSPVVAIPHQDRLLVGHHEHIDRLRAESQRCDSSDSPIHHVGILQRTATGWTLS